MKKIWTMLIWEKKIPEFLIFRKNIVNRILFTAAFALVFINIYAPFGVNTWYNVTKLELFLYSSGLILTGILVMVISRILMFRINKKHKLNYLQYGSWELTEIVIMAFVYTLLKVFFLHEKSDIVDDFVVSLQITALVVILPYMILTLYFSWQDKSKKLESLEQLKEDINVKATKLLPFYDEKEVMRFSMLPSDILYLEAADNYVTIYFLNKQKISHYLLRNSLKNLGEYLSEYSFIRCHRSFIVNFEKVKLIRKEKEGLKLEIDAPSELVIPVSKTYSQEVLNEFIKTGG
ncbi:LytR/AlgR family response regulator transcription factor [Maribellus maritimus]|uniref:LytR/AlgR family response regulator transcription factor n=1 Tax=Maribellus maritimus TaxID=2870838 RepID=UPI001EEA84BE|nr:LytTR family DNA-binding domain-containing protein [Maribellus maritimus]MCG6186059.1 LytTR family transcriptional regulator [Maribellus maritimus]